MSALEGPGRSRSPHAAETAAPVAKPPDPAAVPLAVMAGTVPAPAPGAPIAQEGLLAALDAWASGASLALALVESAGVVAWVNAAFEALTGLAGAQARGRPLQALLGDSLALSSLPPDATPARRALPGAGGATVVCDVHGFPASGGLRMLVLVDRGKEAAQEAEIRRLASVLDFVQASARIGLWERDVRTLEGRWDPHMFRFFGLDPARGTPALDQATLASLPGDHLLQALTESLQKPGRYSHRYRLLRADGSLGQVQTHWEVTAGADGTPEHVRGLVMDDTETFSLASSQATSQAGANAELQIAIELADVGVWRQDLATDRVHFFNDRARVMLGLPPGDGDADLDGIRERVHPDDVQEVVACYERALKSRRPEDLQARYLWQDGRWHHILTRRVTQFSAGGEPVAFNGVALDITDQVERTQDTDELARQLDAVTSASGIGVWRLRRDRSGAEWNRQFYAICGLPPDGPPPPRFDDWIDRCIHPDDRERIRSQGHDWIRHPHAPGEATCRIVQPGGQVRHVVLRGKVDPPQSTFSLSGVMIDVTERERAIAAWREVTERSALATHAAGLGIWEWDVDTLDSRWDEQMFLLRGLAPRPDAPSVEQMSAFVHPDDRAFVNEQIHSARVEDRTAYYEFRIVRPDGEVRWLASSSMPVRDEKGRTRMRLGVNWDVTEAREAAAARQERALALRESQAKSELLARMSHELRTPMNAVLGFTQLLLADDVSEPGSTRHARLEHIRAAGEHLLSLIDDVLEVSRLDGATEDLVLQPVPLDALIAQTLPLVERLAAQHEIALHAATRPLAARADPTRLKQVLVNLLTNAIKYNRPGGHVRIEVVPEGERILLRVSDSGVGMTKAQQTLAFEPFNRAGAEREGVEGTGIGLTIVKALVERMGGRIAVRSTPGVGSVFEVRLEAAGDPDLQGRPARRLLYIEDNAVNVLIVSELVRRRGDIAFDSAIDGESGVERAVRDRPGLVLVDMQLPDITGLQVLERLRAHPATAGLTVIALSANAIPEDIQRALQAGFDEYWTKPLDFAVFDRAMDRVFGSPTEPAS
jgi:signal transduction histidine kinase/ActR/RegA family two-component response regulator